MIVFDLKCERAAHVFEAWFGSSADFDSQRERGLITCPMCGDSMIDKALMAPNLGPKSNQMAVTRGNAAARVPELSLTDAKAAMAKLATMQATLLQNSTWVGQDFATQARAMEDGIIAKGAIHGQASLTEAKSLIDDGIAVLPLPLPIVPPSQQN